MDVSATLQDVERRMPKPSNSHSGPLSEIASILYEWFSLSRRSLVVHDSCTRITVYPCHTEDQKNWSLYYGTSQQVSMLVFLKYLPSAGLHAVMPSALWILTYQCPLLWSCWVPSISIASEESEFWRLELSGGCSWTWTTVKNHFDFEDFGHFRGLLDHRLETETSFISTSVLEFCESELFKAAVTVQTVLLLSSVITLFPKMNIYYPR